MLSRFAANTTRECGCRTTAVETAVAYGVYAPSMVQASQRDTVATSGGTNEDSNLPNKLGSFPKLIPHALATQWLSELLGNQQMTHRRHNAYTLYIRIRVHISNNIQKTVMHTFVPSYYFNTILYIMLYIYSVGNYYLKK